MADLGTLFTCFTGKKVQILTSLRGYGSPRRSEYLPNLWGGSETSHQRESAQKLIAAEKLIQDSIGNVLDPLLKIIAVEYIDHAWSRRWWKGFASIVSLKALVMEVDTIKETLDAIKENQSKMQREMKASFSDLDHNMASLTTAITFLCACSGTERQRGGDKAHRQHWGVTRNTYTQVTQACSFQWTQQDVSPETENEELQASIARQISPNQERKLACEHESQPESPPVKMLR
jgi:hypothetical protein